MKHIYCISIIILLYSSVLLAQTTEYKTHLFLGSWVAENTKENITEKWIITTNGELQGTAFSVNDNDSGITEIMRLIEINGKLNFCATVLLQNPDRKQNEVCFALISYKDDIFEFENPNHDFPKKIIYDFSGYEVLTARIEGGNKSFDIKYRRSYDITESFSLKGKLIKEAFVNKAGKVINDVYDYFYEIQGKKYFIKLSDGSVSKDVIEANLNKNITATITFCSGLWDTDDNTHQSRIGKYIRLLRIY